MDDAFFTELDEEEPAVEPRSHHQQQDEVKWTSKAPFECSKCQRTFHYEKSFLKHLSTYHGEKAERADEIFQCGTCQQTFVNRNNLRAHERHVHSEERQFLCTVCSKTFKRRKDVQRHQRQVHERDNHKHVCSVCGKSLSCKAALLLHERIHTGTKPYQCDVCNAKFIQKTALKMHQRTHTGERPFACNLCSARFTQKHMLSYHIRSHTGEKPFMCEDCGKSFSSREYLRHHSNIHTGIKPFKCKQCGKGFSQRNSLSQHLKTHTGVRPYKCTSCEKDFTQLSALQRHQRIHTGEKPYMCNTCNRTFTDTSTLRRHTKTHSSDAPWKSFMVILSGNIEDKKPPPSLKIKSPKTVEKKIQKNSNSDDEEEEEYDEPKTTETPPTPPPVTATECSTVAIPSDWASHGAIALVSHSTLAGITVIHTEIPAGTKLQPLVTADGSGASVLSLENSGIAVPFSLAANVATTASIPTVTVSNGALAIVTESQAVPGPSVLEVAASQTILAPTSEAKSPERDEAASVETVLVGDTAVEVVEVKSENLEKNE